MDTQTVIAWPVVRDVPALLAFLAGVFGATETSRAVYQEGGYVVGLQIGDTRLLVSGGGPEFEWRGDVAPMAFHIYVPDTDAAYRRALDAGAQSLQAPADQEWGERTANVKDPSGNCWYIATFQGENYFSDGAPTIQPFLQPAHGEAEIGFLRSAFGAIELGRAATEDGVILHTTLKIGSSALELSDASGIYQPMPGAFLLNVPDVDSAYAHALECGGMPADPDSVKDVAGNIWHLAKRSAEPTGLPPL